MKLSLDKLLELAAPVMGSIVRVDMPEDCVAVMLDRSDYQFARYLEQGFVPHSTWLDFGKVHLSHRDAAGESSEEEVIAPVRHWILVRLGVAKALGEELDKARQTASAEAGRRLTAEYAQRKAEETAKANATAAEELEALQARYRKLEADLGKVREAVGAERFTSITKGTTP